MSSWRRWAVASALTLVLIGSGCGGGSKEDVGGSGGTGTGGSGGGGAPSGGSGGGGGIGGVDNFPPIAPTPGKATYSFNHDQQKRELIVFVPSNYAPGMPLVVVLHGGGGSAQQMFKAHPLEQAGTDYGVVVIAAQGVPLDGDPSSYEWNGQPALDSGVDDLGYLAAVIDGVTSSLEIDPTRRFVAGFSGGASMAVRFGAERSDWVAAIGTFAGKVGLSIEGAPFVYPELPASPISVQMTYGTLDENFVGEVKGNVAATSAQQGIDWWAAALNCGMTPQTTMDGVLTSHSYAGCDGSAEVRFNVVEGMDHTWPELPDDLIDGTALMFDFFADKSKPE